MGPTKLSGAQGRKRKKQQEADNIVQAKQWQKLGWVKKVDPSTAALPLQQGIESRPSTSTFLENENFTKISRVNEQLQHKDMTVDRAVSHLTGLKDALQDIRDTGIDVILDEASNICAATSLGIDCFFEEKRVKKRKRLTLEERFPIGDAVSKQTSAPPWDYTPQPYNSIPNFSGETHLNHRQVPVIHNQNIPQFDRKENSLNIPGHDNSNPLAHYSTNNNNSHQSIVRPTALVNCHSNCNACCNHSNRVSHWNVTSDGRYLDNSSSLPKDLPRYPNISSYSHEESKFVGDFASSLNKLSRFSREKANPNHPGFVSPAVEQDHVSPIVNSSAKALNTSSAVSSDSIPVKKGSCATCQDGCQSSCRFFKHQSSVQFPNQDNIHQDQHSISATQENVVRYMGHTALNNATSNQWHMSNRPQTGMWLPNGHYPPFWVQPDNVRMNASGSVSFWGDRNEEISSNISQPMRSSFHGMARYKSHMMNQKVVRLHEAEQKKIQDIARYNEVQRPRYQDSSSNKSEENYQDPGRYHDAHRKAHTVQFHDLPKQSSQTLNYSEAMNKEFAGHSNDGLAPSSTKLQGISRNTITSSELGQGVAAPYPVEQDGTRRYTDISNAHPARSMATHFNTNSQANINFTTGIAQPPSRFSSHVTYTQSKITKTNNYMQCIYPPIETSEKNTNFVPVGSKMAYANSEIVPSNRNQYTSVVKESGSNFEFVTNSVDKNSDVIKYCDSKNSDPGPNYSTLQPCNKMSDSTVLGKTMQVVDCPGLVKTKPYFCNQTLQGSNNFYSDIPRYVQTKVSHSYENLNGSKAYHMFGENNMPANLHSLQQTYQINPIPAQNSSSAITSNVSILPPDKASSDLEDSSYVDEHNPHIYNRSPFEDGTGRYIKKRRSRLKGISKKSQNLHSNKNNQTLRQYLANWDEECDDVTTNPKLPDVVPSNNVEPVLVLDYRSLGNDGLSSLQADVGIGRPADSGLIQMTYQEIDDMNTLNKQSLQNIPEECEHIDGNIGEASLSIQKTSNYVESTLEDSKEKEPLTNTSLPQDCQHLKENTSEVTLSPIEDYSKTNSIISPGVPERDLTLNEQEVLENSANNRVEERKGNIVFHQSAKESLSTTEEHTVHNFETLFSEHSSDSARTNFATGTPSSSVLECPSIGTEDQSPSYSGNQSGLSNKNTNKIPVSDSLLQKSLSTSKNINISNEAIDALLKDCAEFSENILPKLHSQEEVENRCNNVDIDENIDDILQTVNQDNSSTISQNTIFAPINSENKDVVVSENGLRTSAIVSTFVKELEKNKEQTQIQPKRIGFKSEKNTTPTPCHNTFVDSEMGEIPSKSNKLEIKPFSKIVAKQILAPEEETTNLYYTSKEQFITNVEKQDKEAEVNTSTTSQSSFKNEASFENILGDNIINYSNKENLSSIIGKEVDTPVFEVCGKDKPTIHSIELIKNSSPDVIVTGFEDKDKINSSDRGNSTTDLSEKHIVLKEGSKENKECEIKPLKKRSSNSLRVPETCQVCGSHYKDKAEKIEHVKEHLYHCQQCHIAFNSKGKFVRHRSSRHPRTKEQHHCLLCQRTFPTLQRHQLHLSGHLHRHLETAQRRTIHTLFRLFTGNDCPALTPLSEEEASGVSWFPAEGGAIHFYHQAPPLQIAVQDYIWKRRDMGGSADDSNIHEPSHDAGTSTR
uniref:C2H2-type domain-containing protein n=1 Tax=Timema poppense TaxID=170557 RepID=A0A7R9CW50_TIMPO|nr:unnamed protein product [Timema poppensis]